MYRFDFAKRLGHKARLALASVVLPRQARPVIAIVLFLGLVLFIRTDNVVAYRSTPPLKRNPRSQATVVRLHLASAPFPHPNRVNGFLYQDVFYPYDSDYSDPSVIVYVPPEFTSRRSVNLVFFFHGWLTNIDDIQEQFQLYRQFAQSGVNALLVLPEVARNAPDSFGGKLEDPGGFSQLVKDLVTSLNKRGIIGTTRLGTIALAGHSGAYEVVARILQVGGLSNRIREVYLFDALYDLADRFADWIALGGKRFVSVSMDQGSTEDVTDYLVGELRIDGIPLTEAWDDPSQDDVSLGPRVTFLRSPHDHYGVVSAEDEFRRVLAASPFLRR